MSFFYLMIIYNLLFQSEGNLLNGDRSELHSEDKGSTCVRGPPGPAGPLGPQVCDSFLGQHQ